MKKIQKIHWKEHQVQEQQHFIFLVKDLDLLFKYPILFLA
jgi:hypothetical protein